MSNFGGIQQNNFVGSYLAGMPCGASFDPVELSRIASGKLLVSMLAYDPETERARYLLPDTIEALEALEAKARAKVRARNAKGRRA